MARTPHIVANLFGAGRCRRSDCPVVPRLIWRQQRFCRTVTTKHQQSPGAVLVWPRRSRGPVLVDDVLLFLFAGADCRLPCGDLLTWSGSNCLDFLLFGLLGFPIAPLLAFGHADFSLSFDNAVVEWQYLIDCHQAR